jgi:hypothetical protein
MNQDVHGDEHSDAYAYQPYVQSLFNKPLPMSAAAKAKTADLKSKLRTSLSNVFVGGGICTKLGTCSYNVSFE